MRQIDGTVDISQKAPTLRRSVAESTLVASTDVVEAVRANGLPKKDPIATARAAAMLAVKQTPALIPHCHPVAITGITVEFELKEDLIRVRCEVVSHDRTGPEIEALCGASVAALTLYDVIKNVYCGARIEGVRLIEKDGGKSGHWVAEETD